MNHVSKLVLAIVLGVAAQSATGQESRARARTVLPPELFSQVEQIAAEAAQEGLPAEPLWDKALEGAAKRVPPERIAPALAEYARRLGDARGALGADPSAAAIVAGADALRRGVPTDALARVPRGERASMALVVLADLVETGVPTDRAIDVIRAALEQRAGDEDMLGLAARVRAAMRRGEAAGDAADGLRRAIREGRVRGDSPAPDAARPPTRPTRDAATGGR